MTPEKVAAWEGSLTPEDKAHLPEKVRTVLAIAVNGRNAKQDQLVLDAYRNADKTRHVVAALGGADPLTCAALSAGAERARRPGKADRGSEKGSARHPDDADGARADGAARNAHPPGRRLPAQGRPGDAGRAGRAAAAAGSKSQIHAARPGELDRRSEKSADGARDGQPHVAGVFRPGPGGDGERLRHAGDAAEPPRIARLAGVGVHGPRLEHEGDAQTHRLLGDLPAVVEGAGRTWRRSTRAIGCWPGRAGCGWTRRSCATPP